MTLFLLGFFSLLSVVVWHVEAYREDAAMARRILKEEEEETEPSHVCVSEACQNYATSVRTGLNTSINPCDDFYAYACGSIVKAYEEADQSAYPWSRGEASVATRLNLNTLPLQKKALEKLPRKEGDLAKTSPDKAIESQLMKIRRYVDICSRQSLPSTLELLSQVAELVTQAFDPWKAHHQAWTEEEVEGLSRTLVRLKRLGVATTVEVNVAKWDSSVKLVITPRFDTAWELGHIGDDARSEIMQALQDRGFSNMPSSEELKIIGERPAEPRGNFWTNESVFSNATTGSWNDLPQFQEAWTAMTIRGFTIDWQAYFDEWSSSLSTSLQLDNGLPPRFACPGCSDFSGRPAAELVALKALGPRLLRSTLAITAVSQLQEAISQKLGAAYPPPVLERFGVHDFCAIKLLPQPSQATGLSWLLARGLLRELQAEEFKEEVRELMQKIIDTTQTLVGESDWMEAGREIADEKLRNMGIRSLYPDWLMDDEMVNDVFGSLQYPDFVTSVPILDHLSQAWWEMAQAVEVGYPSGTFFWLQAPAAVNAIYNRVSNRMSVSAALARPEEYLVGEPLAAVRFGGLGSIVGHEVSHAFDSDGFHFNAHGQRDENVWPLEVKVNFNKRVQCFQDQFDAMQDVAGHKFSDVWDDDINDFRAPRKDTGEEQQSISQRTLAENIADTGGLNIAWHAYQAWLVDISPKEPVLEGLEDVAASQHFFLAFARFYCAALTPEKRVEDLRTQNHLPNEARVNGAVQNSPAFADAFKCPSGSPMHPSTRCRLWA